MINTIFTNNGNINDLFQTILLIFIIININITILSKKFKTNNSIGFIPNKWG